MECAVQKVLMARMIGIKQQIEVAADGQALHIALVLDEVRIVACKIT